MGGLQKLQTALFLCHHIYRRYYFCPILKKEIFLTKHRFGEAQTRDRLKERKTRTRRQIQGGDSGNGNTTDNKDYFGTVGGFFMGSIQIDTMISIRYWRKCI